MKSNYKNDWEWKLGFAELVGRAPVVSSKFVARKLSLFERAFGAITSFLGSYECFMLSNVLIWLTLLAIYLKGLK